MGDWKVGMEIGGIPNLVRELKTCLSAGIEEIRIVTGYRAADVGDLVKEWLPEQKERISFVFNESYAETQMFDSVCIGLKQMSREWEKRNCIPDGIFIFPADIPLFSTYTLEHEMQALRESAQEVIIPSCGGEQGHPLLVRASAVETILRHSGERGLRGALEQLAGREVILPVPDRGVLLDADTPEEFENLLEEERMRRSPDERRCMELLSAFGVEEDRREHCRAVGAVAGEIAEKTGKNTEETVVIRAAGWLHDIAKGVPDHAEAGAELLEKLGYRVIAEMVRTHTEVPETSIRRWDGAAIVYLADKLVKGSCRATLSERFESNRERFGNQPEALEALERRQKLAEAALAEAVRRGFS